MNVSPAPDAPAKIDVAAVFAAASAAHQAGDLERAATGYGQVLRAAPNHIEALYLSGILNFQYGRVAEAVDALERCLALRPEHIPATEALAECLVMLGRPAAGELGLKAVIARFPAYAGTRVQLCALLASQGRWEECALTARACLARFPDEPTALYFLASALRAKGLWPDAAAAYARALGANGQNAAAYDEYGAVLVELKRYEEAEQAIRAAIAIDPEAGNPHTNLGRLLVRLPGKAEEALAHHDFCLAQKPDYAEAHSNRAAALYALGRLDEAEESCRRAISLKPQLAEAHSNLGNVLQRRGDTRNAIDAYSQALAIRPDHPEALWNRGLCLLALGEFKKGWQGFEARWRCRDFVTPDRSLGLHRFNPNAPSAGPLWIWGEQGVGDEIIYGGMVPDLIERGLDVVLECDQRLAPLWRRSFPQLRVVGRGGEIGSPSPVSQLPIASLGSWLRPTEASFPSRRAYFTCDEKRRQEFRGRLGAARKKVVAVSWLSRNDELGAGKSASLAQWRPILSVAGATFVSAQYGETAGQRRDAEAATGVIVNAIDDLDTFADLDGLAALLSACDLVITVSNTTAHLAGALGVPTWVLCPAGAGRLWYWFNGRSDTPWYPSVRLLRQINAGIWDEPIRQAAASLDEFCRR